MLSYSHFFNKKLLPQNDKILLIISKNFAISSFRKSIKSNQVLYWEANAGSFVKGEMEDAAKRNKADGELEICAGKAR